MLFPVLLLAALAVDLPPGVVIDHQPAATRQYIGSPSIIILPGGDYVASHDFFGAGSTQSVSAVSRVFRSTDKGATWKQAAEFKDQFWSNLFLHKDALYLMGTTYEYGRMVIRKSTDKGFTWSAASYLTDTPGFHTAPVPMAISKGRIWRAFEFHPEGAWGNFEAFLVSASLHADLTKPGSWKMTQRLAYPGVAAPPGQTWLEGNAVVGPRGEIFDILRVHDTEKAAITRLEGDALRFVELVEFPGGAKKFTIRWDKKSRRYWTLSNPALPEFPLSAKNPASVRNTLVLMSSPDLRAWKVERRVLQHPDVAKHAFQYVDWQFDGADLVAAIRTGFDDEEGGPPRAHDANFLTFFRVANFRRP